MTATARTPMLTQYLRRCYALCAIPLHLLNGANGDSLGSRRSAQHAARNRHLSARRVRRPAAEGAKPATAPKDLVADRCRRRDDRAVPYRQEHLDVLVRARVRR